MNNKQKAENFLNLAKEAKEYDNDPTYYLEVAKTHSMLALEEAIRDMKGKVR